MVDVNEVDLSFLDGVDHPKTDSIEDLMHIAKDEWYLNDSTFTSYCNVAERCGLYGVKDRIYSYIGKFTSNVVALDIAGGANGGALQELLSEDKINTGIVTNLRDTRTPETSNRTDLLHIEGDLVERDTWRNIINAAFEASNGEGLSLVMHRPAAPLQLLHPRFYQGSLRIVIDLLRDGGVFFTQVPAILNSDYGSIYMDEICAGLNYRSDIATAKRSSFTTHNTSALIVKASQ